MNKKLNFAAVAFAALSSFVAGAQVPKPGSGGSAGGGGGVATIQDEGTGLAARTILNFTGSGISCVDNAGATRTDCTVSGGGGGTVSFTPNAQTGTSYAITSANCGQALTFSNASAIAVSLPATPLASDCTLLLKTIGAGEVTVTPLSGTISGAASITLSTGEFALVVADGTNYEAVTNRALGGTGLLATKARTGITWAVDTSVVQSINPCSSTTGNDTYTCTLSPVPGSLTNLCLTLTADASNQGVASVNPNGLGNVGVLSAGGLALNDRDIINGVPARMCYDGANFVMQTSVPLYRSRNGGSCYDEFLGVIATTSTGPCSLIATVSSGATSASAGEANAPGIIDASTSTSSSGAVLLRQATSGILFGGGTYVAETRARVVTLGTAGERFTAQTGFLDTNTATPVDGCFFRYNDNVNSGLWLAVCANNSTETTSNTGVGPTANTWQIFRITVNAAATSVEFRIDGSVVATITTNIPSTAGRETTYVPLQIIKSAGTTARLFQADYGALEIKLTTAR